MRSAVQKSWFLAISLLVAVLSPAFNGSAAQIQTNWAAYNDHAPGPPPRPSVGAWGTAAKVTAYDMRLGPAGNLTNFLDGQKLPVTMLVTANGTPDAFGNTGPPYPIDNGTPAYNIFFGVVDVGNTNSVIGVRRSANTYTTLTFSNLNPAKHYVFRGTSARGGGYGLRWTVATLIGAQSWVDAHLNGSGPGVLTSNNFPELGAGQAAYNSGDNRPGAVVGWDFISPAADGTFSVQSSNYIGHINSTTLADGTVYGYAIAAFLLAEVEAAKPAIDVQPAAQTTVEENRSVSLSVSASGTPLFYQWYKQGVGALSSASATTPTLTIAQAALGDAGDYYVRVYNPLGAATSTVAHVTVTADTHPPGINTAFTYPTVDFNSQAAVLDQVVVEFNEAVQAASAGDRTRYTISGGVGNPASVIVTNASTVVLKLASPLAEDTPYTVQVNGVLDLVGNNINNGGTNNPASFRSWVRNASNGLLYEEFQTGAGVDVTVLTGSPNFPNNPRFRTNLWAFDTRLVHPDDTAGGYGSRIRGVFIPPVSGDWRFFLRAWDRGTLYLNPNGLDSAGKQAIAAEVTGNNPRDWNKLISPSFYLHAGQGYYIESLQQADLGTGIDALKVAARLVSDGLPQLQDTNTGLDTNSIFGAPIAAPLAPKELVAPLTITQQPADLTLEENHIATFSVQVSNPYNVPVWYQWFRDGSPIDRAFGSSYSLQVTNSDNGATFSVQISKLGSTVTSRTATLTVVPDTHPPHVADVISSSTNLAQLIVRYDEIVQKSAAEDTFNYDLGTVGTASATLQADGTTVIVGLQSSLVLGQRYSVTIYNIRDIADHGLDPDPTTVSFVAGTDVPRLKVLLTADGYIDISWPAPSAGFVLEEASQILTPVSSMTWTAVSTPPAVINGRNVVSIYTDSRTKVYRLHQ